MSHGKGSSPVFRDNAAGLLQRLAKQVQRDFKLTFTAALTKARDQLGLSAASIAFTYTPTALSIAFDSTVTLNGATVATYAWDFGDGQTAATADPTNVYGGAGTYTVTVTMTDTLGNIAQSRQVITASA